MCDWGITQVFLTFATDAKGQTLYEKMVEKIFGHSRGCAEHSGAGWLTLCYSHAASPSSQSTQANKALLRTGSHWRGCRNHSTSRRTVMHTRAVFPFTAIVGQESIKLALLLNAISPVIGGVLIRGHKGTAKSTAVRALSCLLPDIEVVTGCPFACDLSDAPEVCPHCAVHPASRQPMIRPAALVELPLGATEDRVVGTLDIERALKSGEKHFEPGLLAAAHRGLLYIDEVNLLSDHLVDILLDAAAMGVNYIEREGISVSHPAAFILVGTMNPEEGELRPQLLDRFGLAVDVQAERDVEVRAEVVRRRIAFDRDPEG